ncbi:TIGR03564 family F420-dependent LLM class oxidoreductase [Mycobacterium sp. TJFP1]
MTIGLTLSPAPSDNAIDTYIASAELAAASGIDTVWVAQFFDVDALSVAALIGHAVPNISVGTAVVPIYPRHPLVVASQALTAQAASHGRFQMGVGLGSPPLIELAYGVATRRIIRHLREYLTALRTVLTTGSVELHGETLTAVSAMPVAVDGAQAPPLLLGAAVGEQSLRIAGELADGIFPYLSSPRTISDITVPKLAAAAQRAGRPMPRIVAVIPAIVTSNPDAARRNAADHMAFYDDVPAAQISMERERVQHAHELAVIGDEETVARAIGRYFDAGATEVSIAYSHVSTPAEHRRTIALLGELNRSRTPDSQSEAPRVTAAQHDH